MKLRRIVAIVGIVFLIGLYISTLVFALMKSPNAQSLLTLSIYCTVAVPVFLYAFGLVSKYLKERDQDHS
ncbi:hypothetical protein GPL15_23110 [Clostridium sp. MCC353]|uniref:hypothetical protein n=1 Tax=Clostridium sp. MCC353 TaxID=2592646 RepID=UPI001C009E31|nr:hypothetical protein [Clostridium sp. MCC353]MBT9779373.1 hypothetical protein [Clostridium sp. MCC353]